MIQQSLFAEPETPDFAQMELEHDYAERPYVMRGHQIWKVIRPPQDRGASVAILQRMDIPTSGPYRLTKYGPPTHVLADEVLWEYLSADEAKGRMVTLLVNGGGDSRHQPISRERALGENQDWLEECADDGS